MFDTEIEDHSRDLSVQLHRWWANRHVVLRVQWVGSGGAAMLDPTDALASDPDLIALHSAGYYRDRQIHISL